MQKKIRVLLPALALAIGVSSCSEDFDVLAPAKPFTVVYGILDASEPVNYVRIQRAYADPNKSALDLAKLPDSSYFANITVTMQETGSSVPPVTLNRVSMADKNPGTFFTTPNYAYEINQPLMPGRTYRLLIKNNDNGNVDTAETVIANVSGGVIQEVNPAAPNPDQKVELSPTNSANSYEDGTYSWRVTQYPQSPTIKYMNAVVRFHFQERLIGGGAQTEKLVDYIFSRPVNTGGNGWDPSRVIASKFSNFYIAIANGLGDAPAGMERLAGDADLIAYFGTPELYAYQQNQIAAGGLGGDQVQFRYTNIRGKNVIGVLASRGKIEHTKVPLSNGTVAELKVNTYTQRCNITGRATP